jgi:hypothetical protein
MDIKYSQMPFAGARSREPGCPSTGLDPVAMSHISWRETVADQLSGHRWVRSLSYVG